MKVYHDELTAVLDEIIDITRGDHRDRDYWEPAPGCCQCPRHRVAWAARPVGRAPLFDDEDDGAPAPFRVAWRGGLPESELWHRHVCDCGRETDCDDVRCSEPRAAVCDGCAGVAR